MNIELLILQSLKTLYEVMKGYMNSKFDFLLICSFLKNYPNLDLVSERKKLQTGSYVSVTFKPTTTFSMIAAPVILWGGPKNFRPK